MKDAFGYLVYLKHVSYTNDFGEDVELKNDISLSFSRLLVLSVSSSASVSLFLFLTSPE